MLMTYSQMFISVYDYLVVCEVCFTVQVITRTRVPRHVSPYIALHPYSSHEAAGMALLASLCHGHYMQTDLYIAHAALSEANRPDVILISDK